MIVETIGLASAFMTLFSIQNPLVPYIRNKIKENQYNKLADIQDEKIDEYLKECLMQEMQNMESNNISAIISNNDEIVEKIVSKNPDIIIFKTQILEYIKEFETFLTTRLKGGCSEGESKIIDLLIEINKKSSDENSEYLNGMSSVKQKILEMHTDVITKLATNEKQLSNALPFKFEEIDFTTNIFESNIQYDFSCKLNDINYMIKPDVCFYAIESSSSVIICEKDTMFFCDKEPGSIKNRFISRKYGIRKIKGFSMMCFLEVKNWNIYYLRIFGSDGNYYYDWLTEQDYKFMMTKMNDLYKISSKDERAYQSLFYNIMYASF